MLYDRILDEKVQFENICGVPYTALPMSTLIAVKGNKPMVLRRKEAKGYGTKQLVEGIYEKGDRCVIVEDVISTGSSILETIAVSGNPQYDVKIIKMFGFLMNF